uniref:U43-Deinotoxin-Dsu1j_1 n=1 Tax=Deinopis subrufa TaxID=1905329 RepID=A0A4Q8K4B8_DEISU
MKLLVIFVCVALFVFVKGESEVEVEEMEQVEEETERGCVGKWGKCNDNADCCTGMSCKCYHVGWFKHECECKNNIRISKVA